MRYEPAERLLRLARSLAATRAGLTLDEMAAELEVGRRTAERLPGSVLVWVIEPPANSVAAVETPRASASNAARPTAPRCGQ